MSDASKLIQSLALFNIKCYNYTYHHQRVQLSSDAYSSKNFVSMGKSRDSVAIYT